MITDAQCLLADALAITATGIATNVYDSGAAGNDIGIGEPMCVVITVDVAADFTTTDETYQFDVNASAAAALSTPTTLARRIIAASLLTVGSVHVIPIPPGAKLLRYLGLNVTLGGTTPSITYTAFIQPLCMVQMSKPYADNIAIS